jgi:hypothetical protein
MNLWEVAIAVDRVQISIRPQTALPALDMANAATAIDIVTFIMLTITIPEP